MKTCPLTAWPHTMTTLQPTSAMLATSTRFWDKTARKYAAAAIADTAGYEQTVQRVHQRLQTTDRVLELGCGTATTALRLASASGHYAATDLSPAMLDLARQKLASAPPDVHRVLHLLVADADADVPAPAPLAPLNDTAAPSAPADAGWDVVLAFNLLHLVSDLDGALASAVQALRPGGLLISKTACVAEMNPLIRWLAIPVMQAIGKAPHVLLFDTDTLQAAMVRQGLVIEAVERHGTKGKDIRVFIVARKPS